MGSAVEWTQQAFRFLLHPLALVDHSLLRIFVKTYLIFELLVLFLLLLVNWLLFLEGILDCLRGSLGIVSDNGRRNFFDWESICASERKILLGALVDGFSGLHQDFLCKFRWGSIEQLWRDGLGQAFQHWWFLPPRFEWVLGEVIDDVVVGGVQTWILLLFKDLGGVVMVLTRHLIDAFVGAVSDVHEVLEGKAWFAEVLISLIPSILGDVELVIKIEFVWNLASIHSSINIGIIN
jgi:hypothetical protein